MSKYKYNIGLEQKNITHYSPFWHINELSPPYRTKPFPLPLIKYQSRVVPIHPDMLHDLGISKSKIVKKVRVYPTSSFRTVYYPKKNICWKLPVKRKITRGVRDLATKQLQRSVFAQKKLSEFKCKNFSYLPEKCCFADNENFNVIERTMPNRTTFPLFYVVRSKMFSRKFVLQVINNVLFTWMFWANKRLYLEYHTQNILVDDQGQIIYRDLSDIKSHKYKLLQPQYYASLKNRAELASIIFDRSVCEQNLNHFQRYKDFSSKEIGQIKKLIQDYSAKFRIILPDYSLDFDPHLAERIPYRQKLTAWRS